MKKRRPTVWPYFVRRLIEITCRQQQTQRTLLDWLRVEYEIEKPSAKQKAETGEPKAKTMKEGRKE